MTSSDPTRPGPARRRAPPPSNAPASPATSEAAPEPARPDPTSTPMMQQYLDAKAACPDALVMMRMGDFYELFLEDAVEAAELLELTLTARNKKDDHPIPMAGVPYHALQTYLPRLLAAGRKVAIVEQVEDPKLAKGLVRREIARVVSPGVVLDEAVLDTREPNWLAAIAPPLDGASTADAPARWGLAWLDVSTGLRHATARASLAEILTELARIEPKEIVVPRHPGTLAGDVRAAFPKVALAQRDLGPRLAASSPVEAATDAAADLVLDYAKDLHRGGELALRPLVILGPGERMALPATTVRNLELLRAMMDGGKKGSLLGLLDQTRTAMGSRLLRSWLLAPLLDRASIQRRHDAVHAALDAPLLRAELRDFLRGVSDLERLVGRVAARVATPRDLAALATSLERVPELASRLASADPSTLTRPPDPASSAPGPLAALAQGLDPVEALAAEIRRLLVEEPPPTLKEGGVIREGADPELDQLIAIARDGKDWFEAYEARLRDASKIPSVKIRFNSVFGYYIEVTRANLHLVPDTWLRKQTLANAERYYTVELKEREDKVLGADDKRLALEERLFTGLREHAAAFGARVQATAQHLAELDVLLAFAELAATRGWVRPTLVDEPLVDIRGGRHPVVEATLPPGSFVPNDLVLAPDRRLVILTGPNMAGKSTVMRQTAIIAILAQIGAFVPAEAATLGLVDKVFTRVGASDDLARGQSTFMVEMTETAEILREATDRSLVVLDEIGRGTSTWDGLSIAWAVAEHLHDQTRCLALFATHYHELTELASTRDAVRNLSIAVREQANEVVFLRRLIEGGASKSYGIQVARLAGLPDALLGRAREVLENLEAMSVDPDSRPRLARGGKRPATWQLSLFAPRSEADPTPPEAPPDPPGDRLAQDLRQLLAVDPDELTPKAALDLVYKLRAAVNRHDGRPSGPRGARR